ncbi:hypothetical protein DB32_003921 [Sandaracinus amylolyticus]|uniref:Uncharacterized protein n=1 Tax=Sandaracinus amylolyticus TaxID=927083 RepID=A0A0F6YIK0_9BACT|nr:hypothetical protein DB32_003921 [Sandaracinus amylolyticus]
MCSVLLLAACGSDPVSPITDAGTDAPVVDAFVPDDAPVDAAVVEDASTADAGSETPAERWVRQVAEAWCAQWPRCGENARVYGSLADCVATQSRPLAELADGLDRGTVEVDPAGEAACREVLATSCDWPAFDFAHPPCRDALVGSVPLGGACGTSLDCGRDAVCAHAGGACPGVCTAAPDVGDECDPRALAPCTRAREHGVVCDPVTGDFTRGICREILRDVTRTPGDRCGRIGDADDDVHILRTCGDGMVCTPLDGENRCVVQVPEGGRCSRSSLLCGPGLGCSLEERCERLEVVTDEGGACDGTMRVCQFDLGLQCAGGVCTRFTEGRVGDSCFDPSSAECDEGLQCDRSIGECAVPLPAGVPCGHDTQCASWTCRDGLCTEALCR